MIILRNRFLTETDKIKYIRACEQAFEKKLQTVSHAVTTQKGVRIITLSGPSCSCKTTVVKKIVRDVNEQGQSIKIISIDDFFLSRSENREEALHRGVRSIMTRSTRLIFPISANAATGCSAAERPCCLYLTLSAQRAPAMWNVTRPITISSLLKGIQAIYPEIRAKLSEHGFMSLFINVEGPVCIDHQVFTGREIRFARRMVRDFYFRNSKAEFTMFMWESVTENEDKNMMPYAHLSDIRIDSFIPYELNMIKEPLEEILSTVPVSDQHYQQAADFRARFAHIQPISRAYLPEDSMYREFLG